MSDTTKTGHPGAGEAQALLAQADQIGASVRTGAGWPQIATLLGLGAVSAMGVVALGLAAQAPGTPVVLSIVTMMVWILIFTTMAAVFTQANKRGFGVRWAYYIGAWALLWVAAMVLGGTVLEGELWFSALMAALITLTTTACAWYEARR